MAQVKFSEVLASCTFIPALAVRLDPTTEEERYLAARAGFGREASDQQQFVILVHLQTMACNYDEYAFPGGCRTMQVALNHIRSHWDELATGSVIDVQFILGESTAVKESERDLYSV